MKRILLVAVLAAGLLSSIGLTAQEVDKKPLIELFTASTCPPCVMGNEVLDGVLAYYSGQYTLIKYQMNWPGAGDPYYMEESAVRRAYYEVSGVPHLRTNGVSPGYPQQYTRAAFESLLSAKTNMSISAEAAVQAGGFKTGNDGLTVNCNIDLIAHAEYAAGLRAFAMIVEQKTFGNVGTNGETIFHNVCQGYVIGSEGELLPAFAADETKSFELSIDLSGSNVETGNDLSLVVFVQNLATGLVVQSEMVEVSHPFVDYSVKLNVYDEDYNKVDGGRVEVEMAGKEVIIDSKAEVNKLLPGTYYYQVVVPGLFPYDGEFTISDGNVEHDIFVEVPPFLFYEDFENGTVPNGWTFHNPNNDYLAVSGGRVVFQRTGADDAAFLILPKVKIDQGVVFSVKVGDSQGRSDVGFGIVTNPQDPLGTYSEFAKYEIFGIEGMRAFAGRIDDPALVGDGYIAIRLYADLNSYYYLDEVIIIEGQPGSKVQFLVKNDRDEILPEAEVVMLDEGIPTNDFGYSTWRNVDAGEYSYAVSYQGVEFETGTVTVDGDVFKEIIYSTAGIADFEEEKILVYPNPASELITFKGITSGKVQILNVEGKVVLEKDLRNGNTINISELPEGVYVIKLNEMTQKLLKK